MMGRTGQTLETIRTDFDRIAALAGERWGHNVHYHAWLLAQLPERLGRVLEIGCGAGEFSRRLAGRAASVLAVDLSPLMISVARERTRLQENVEFVNADVMACEFADGEFDCVATLTTLHHLPTEAALEKISRALKPGGVFLCLDLYRRASAADLLYDCAAYPLGLLLRISKTGRLRPPREVREAFAEHGKTDTYLTLRQAERVCAEVMPGAVVKRHLFWRYSVVWKKPAAGLL